MSVKRKGDEVTVKNDDPKHETLVTVNLLSAAGTIVAASGALLAGWGWFYIAIPVGVKVVQIALHHYKPGRAAEKVTYTRDDDGSYNRKDG